MPLIFERNVGQATSAYQYLARSHSHTVLLTGGDAVLHFASRPRPVSVRMRLAGADPNARSEAEQPLPGLVNYFVGSDPNGWFTNISTFSRIRYREVYPGIDVVYYGTNAELEHDFVLRPGADPNAISMRFEGPDEVRPGDDGSLILAVNNERILWRRPVLYQTISRQRVPVDGSYTRKDDGSYGFKVGAYDRAFPLVIDPVISYATYIGRSAPDAGARMAVDSAGNAYIVGLTFDSAFPRTAGAFSAGAGPGKIVVTKLNPQGTAVLYSTVIGGSTTDGALGMALDGDGNLFIAGSTSSPDYPTTRGALKAALLPPGVTSDGFDCVVTKLNSVGNALLYSTYLGGSGVDACIGIAIDSSGNAYLTGNTTSTNFPTSEEAPQRNARGGRDGFLAKLNATGTGLVYSTLFGGTANDGGVGVAVDSTGAAFVVGYTNSLFGFPVTPGAVQSTNRGTSSTSSITGDAFAFKINPAGTSYLYATFLGGGRDDFAFAVAVDAAGNAYVAGNTTSENFPVTPGAFQTTFRGLGGNNIYRGGDGFVTKLNPTGSALVYSTYLGGSLDDWVTGIAIDSTGNAYLIGSTLSTNFPVTQDAYQRTYGGTDPELGFGTGDAFVAHLNPAGAALVYATYLGGAADEIGFGIALDATGAVHVSGQTRSRNFPVTPGSAQTLYGGSSTDFLPMGDVFVAKFSGFGTTASSNVSLRGIGSSASYAGGGVAPGELVVLGGTGIGPATLTTLTLDSQGRVSTTLAGTRVLFDGTPAPMIYASANQSSAVVPYGVAGRTTTQVVVEYQGQRSAPLTMPVVAAKPALFSANSSGTGPGAILNEDSTVNSPTNPSRRGRIVVLYGTGAGQTNPPGVDGQLATTSTPRPVLDVSVTIGGRTADLLYAGAAPNLVAGVLQINAKIPEDTPPGNAEVIVTIGNARSQPGLTVAVTE